MEKIKFRYWNAEKKEMRPVQGLVFDYNTPTVIENIGENYKEDTDAEAVMQWTGLSDKNGKEIYEGDVLRLNDAPFIEAVHYDGDGFWTSADMATFRVRLGDWGTREVIGNIYENPELLTT